MYVHIETAQQNDQNLPENFGICIPWFLELKTKKWIIVLMVDIATHKKRRQKHGETPWRPTLPAVGVGCLFWYIRVCL